MRPDTGPHAPDLVSRLLRKAILCCGALAVLIIFILAITTAPHLIRRVPEPVPPKDLLAGIPAAKPLKADPLREKASGPATTARPSPSPGSSASSSDASATTATSQTEFNRIAQAVRPIPDFTGLRPDLRRQAEEWNRITDAFTSAALALLAESRGMTFEKAKDRLFDLNMRCAFASDRFFATLPPRDDAQSLAWQKLRQNVLLQIALEHGEWEEAGDICWERRERDAAFQYFRKCGWSGRWVILGCCTSDTIQWGLEPFYRRYLSGDQEDTDRFRREREALRKQVWSGQR